MAVTKITLSTAMRARDVSRPSAEHFAAAAEREAAVTRPAETDVPPAAPPPAQSPRESEPPTVGLPGAADQAEGSPRRRRRRGR
jgi:hypothetical protein